MLTLLIPPDSAEPHGLARGERYVLDDLAAGDYLLKGWGRISGPNALLPAGEWTQVGAPNRNRVILRSGGFGDLICLRPILEALWRTREEECLSHLAVCCHPAHAPALDGLDFLEVIPYPPKVADLQPFHWRLSLENVIEDSTDGRQDTVALLSRTIWPGVKDFTGPEWVPSLTIPPGELAEAWQAFPATGRRRLGLALHSSAHCRNWPLERVAELIHGLGTDIEVFLFGKPGPWPEIDLGPDVTHIHVLPRLNCTLRESLALLATMDVFVGPDSGLVHAAGALRVPTVALFGPFEAGQRVTRYPTVRSIQGRAPCAPCHHHPRTLEQRWPAGKPCQQMQHCVALAGITGAQVLKRVREILDAKHLAAEPDLSE